MSFGLDRRSGAKCWMLSARALSIVWGDDPSCWTWTADLPGSRFPEVAELVDVCWLEITGKLQLSLLSPRTTYAAYLVYAIADDSYGLECNIGIQADIDRGVHVDREHYLPAAHAGGGGDGDAPAEAGVRAATEELRVEAGQGGRHGHQVPAAERRRLVDGGRAGRVRRGRRGGRGGGGVPQGGGMPAVEERAHRAGHRDKAQAHELINDWFASGKSAC